MARASRPLPTSGWLCALRLTALVALVSTPAAAHQQFAPSTVNRYGKLLLSGSHGVRLLYTLMVGDVPALALRRQADRNGDGHVDPSEQAALCRQLGDRARAEIELWIDGQSAAATWDAPQCALSGGGGQPSDAVTPLPLSCELSAHLATPSGHVHTLRYDDRVAMAPIGEVELRIEDGPSARLLTSWQGAAPTAQPSPDPVQRIFQRIGPARSSLSDQSISLRFTVDAAASPTTQPPRRHIPYFAIGLLLTTLLGWALVRFLRPPRPPVRRTV